MGTVHRRDAEAEEVAQRKAEYEWAVEALAPIHETQLLTCLRLGGWKVGLLINFNVPVLKQGILRKVMG
jgi:GxxExxY protein